MSEQVVHLTQDARSYMDGTDERPLDHQDAMIWDLLGALDRLEVRIAVLERERDNARFELQGLEHVRVKDNGYLIARAEAAEAQVRELREALSAIAQGRWNLGTGKQLTSTQFARAALAEQPPAENTDFEWKTQEC